MSPFLKEGLCEGMLHRQATQQPHGPSVVPELLQMVMMQAEEVEGSTLQHCSLCSSTLCSTSSLRGTEDTALNAVNLLTSVPGSQCGRPAHHQRHNAKHNQSMH